MFSKNQSRFSKGRGFDKHQSFDRNGTPQYVAIILLLVVSMKVWYYGTLVLVAVALKLLLTSLHPVLILQSKTRPQTYSLPFRPCHVHSQIIRGLQFRLKVTYSYKLHDVDSYSTDSKALI